MWGLTPPPSPRATPRTRWQPLFFDNGNLTDLRMCVGGGGRRTPKATGDANQVHARPKPRPPRTQTNYQCVVEHFPPTRYGASRARDEIFGRSKRTSRIISSGARRGIMC